MGAGIALASLSSDVLVLSRFGSPLFLLLTPGHEIEARRDEN